MAQTSLAELLRPKPGSLDDETHQRVLATLAPRRVDFAVFDRWGHLALAIEFQGLSSASTRDFVRDAIKRDAIRNAQVPVLEIGVDYSEDEVVASLRSILKRRRSPVGVQARA